MSAMISLPSPRTSAPLLSVIVPVFNEIRTLGEVIRRVAAVPIDKEILVVDDASTDGSTDVVKDLADHQGVRVFFHTKNRGKGAALRTGLAASSGAIIVIQDADLEYDPAALESLIEPITSGQADVVYGSRFAPGSIATCPWHRRWANQLLTGLANRFTGLQLSDMETCYKAIRREVAATLVLREERFGIEPELTAKIARGGWQIVEVAINYKSRTYSAGKKIGIRDGLRAVWCIIRYSRWD